MNHLKLSIITNIYTPYRDIQFKKIRDEYPNLKIFFTGDKRENRQWNEEENDYFVFLDTIFSLPKFGALNKGLIKIVRESDVIIIGGYEQPTYSLLNLLAKIYKKPTILLFDGTAPSRIQNCKKNWKYLIKLLLVRQFSAFWINGKISNQYFTKCFNVDKKKVFNQYLTIDGTHYKNNIFQKDGVKTEIRKQLNIPQSEKVIIYSGRFIERKRVPDIIKCLGKLKSENRYQSITLLLIGDTNQEKISEYTSLSQTAGVTALFSGFIEQEQLYKYYFASDLLVLPSYDEPWGLVVNEALYSEIPVLISNDCGVALDLVVEQKNGYVFACGNINDMSSKMVQALALDSTLVSKTSQEILKIWNFENSIRELEKAVQYILNLKKAAKYKS